MFLENCNTNENIFILASRRRKKSKLCNYLITTSQQDLSRGGPGYVGKLRANFLGTGFILFSNRNDPHDDSAFRDGNNFREVLCSIQYEQNIMGLRGPRKMTVLLPVVAEGTRVHISESLSENSLSDQYLKNPDLVILFFQINLLSIILKKFKLDYKKFLVILFILLKYINICFKFIIIVLVN